MIRLLFVAYTLVSLLACQSAEVTMPTGSLQLTFRSDVDTKPLVLNTGVYQNAAGETFSITKFDYFVSNIRLFKANGDIYTVPQDNSYFLLREADPTSQVMTLPNVPAGEYTQLEFMVGVDSLRNTADLSKRTGVLDPAGSHTSGMYWEWNSGYIHLKLEGTSPQAPLDATGSRNFRYHIGLFGGYQTRTLNNLRTVRVPLVTTSTALRVGPSLATSAGIRVDVSKIFNGPTPIRIATYPDVMVSPISATIANNYATMFSLGSSSVVER